MLTDLQSADDPESLISAHITRDIGRRGLKRSKPLDRCQLEVILIGEINGMEARLPGLEEAMEGRDKKFGGVLKIGI